MRVVMGIVLDTVFGTLWCWGLIWIVMTPVSGMGIINYIAMIFMWFGIAFVIVAHSIRMFNRVLPWWDPIE